MMIATLLNRLGQVRSSGKGWIACCPAHDDDSPSLSIASGYNGRILLHCFAGCTVAEIVAALGLRVLDLFPGPGPRAMQDSRRQRKRQELERRHKFRREGFRIDLRREAAHLIHAARGLDISAWNPDRLDCELGRLAEAYEALDKEIKK